MRSLSNEIRILLYFFIMLLIVWIIFDSLKFSWTDDPFQKVVLAPAGEEPFKLILALSPFIGTIVGYSLVLSLKKENMKSFKKLDLVNIFYYTFISFAIISAIIFGIYEGPLNNILLHFSTTTIAAMLVMTIFQKVKDKKWKIHWKVFAIFFSITLPMFLQLKINSLK